MKITNPRTRRARQSAILFRPIVALSELVLKPWLIASRWAMPTLTIKEAAAELRVSKAVAPLLAGRASRRCRRDSVLRPHGKQKEVRASGYRSDPCLHARFGGCPIGPQHQKQSSAGRIDVPGGRRKIASGGRRCQAGLAEPLGGVRRSSIMSAENFASSNTNLDADSTSRFASW